MLKFFLDRLLPKERSVRIDLPAMSHVAARAPSSTIAQLNEDRLGTLSVAAGALTVIGTTSVEGNLAVGAGATFNASGAVSVGGSLAVSGGTLAMSAAATSTVSASVTNSGTIDFQAGALDLTGAVTNTGIVKPIAAT